MDLSPRRISACLTACAGISTEDLERHGVVIATATNAPSYTSSGRAAAILENSFDWSAPVDGWKWLTCSQALAGIVETPDAPTATAFGIAFAAKGCQRRRAGGRNLILCPPRCA